MKTNIAPSFRNFYDCNNLSKACLTLSRLLLNALITRVQTSFYVLRVSLI